MDAKDFESNQASPRRPATRTDVAKLAGVSPAVVSYVLNPHLRPVADKTRERVLLAMRELSYRPNSMARALKTRTTETLGLVVPDLSNPFYAELARGIEDAARARGFALLLTNSHDSSQLEAEQVNNLLNRQVDGLVLISPSRDIDLTNAFDRQTSTVLMDRVDAHPHFHAIGVEYRAGARAAVEHLIGHGHSRIGIVIGDVDVPSVAERRAGWRDALDLAELPLGPVAVAPYSREGGYQAARTLLQSADRPTAIFVSSDQQAVGVVHACHTLGVGIPDDLAIVSFDGSSDATFVWPTLTTMRQPLEELAPLAVELVTSGLSERPAHEIRPTRLAIGQSCGCP